MIPAYYLPIAIGLSFGAGWVLAVVFSPWYNRKAEQAEQFTADQAERIAKYFSGIAAELRAPGK